MPSGISTFTFFRLFSAAPITFKNPVGCLRSCGTGIAIRPLKYAPVTDSGLSIISCADPAATIRPPCSPALGPTSTIKSASLIVSSSCSTTTRVLPRSRRFFNVASSLSLSLWCRPILGSSKIYATPTSPEPICVARRIRCASPPDKVPVARERLK